MFLTVVANCIVIRPIRVLFNARKPSFIEFKKLPLSAFLIISSLACSVVLPNVYRLLSTSFSSSNNCLVCAFDILLCTPKVLPASDISAKYNDPNSWAVKLYFFNIPWNESINLPFISSLGIENPLAILDVILSSKSSLLPLTTPALGPIISIISAPAEDMLAIILLSKLRSVPLSGARSVFNFCPCFNDSSAVSDKATFCSLSFKVLVNLPIVPLSLKFFIVCFLNESWTSFLFSFSAFFRYVSAVFAVIAFLAPTNPPNNVPGANPKAPANATLFVSNSRSGSIVTLVSSCAAAVPDAPNPSTTPAPIAVLYPPFAKPSLRAFNLE